MVSNKAVLSRMGLVVACLTKELFKRKIEVAGHALRGSGQCGTMYNVILKRIHPWKELQRKAA